MLNDFRSGSGLAINISKCNITPLGPYINNPPILITDLALNVTLGPVTMLGISFELQKQIFVLGKNVFLL